MKEKLFTKQFIKDIFWLSIFGIFFYVATHNSITHPIPKPKEGTWSIQFMQHSLLFGIAGHNYLALRNGNGDIVEELHGLATDEKTQKWTYVGYKATDVLQVWHFNGPLYQINNKQYPGIILKEGSKETVKETWDKATPCIDAINVKKIPYPSLGISIKQTTKNSNSVAYTLSYCMELDAKHLGLITPGSEENLLK